MSGFPGSPRVLKGAVVGIDPAGGRFSVIVFQYNPDTLTRTLQPKAAAGGGAGASKSEVLRLQGPPQETIHLDMEIDAADQLGQGDPIATSLGIHPTLAALETLLYPSAVHVIANEVLAALGVIELIPPEAPLTLLVWGPKRILPVRINELSITEEAFDPGLNPIRAKVGIGVRVLSYDDLGLLSPGGAIFMAHQVIKETMAAIGTAESLAVSPSTISLLPGGI
jgi:hypothetical protein